MSELEMRVAALMRLAVAEDAQTEAQAREDIAYLLKHGGGKILSEKDAVDAETIIGQILLELGAPDHLSGHPYLIQAVVLAASDPGYIRQITYGLYPKLAVMFDTTSSRVERAIRHVIEVTWSRGDMDVLGKYFGNIVDPAKGRPTNGEFIARMANVVKQRLKDAA